MENTLTIELICHSFPNMPGERAACIGVQEKKDVVEAFPYAAAGEVRFQIALQVETNSEQGSMRFKGKAVQGTAAEPFLYLSWGNWAVEAGGAWVMVQRTKVQLASLPRELLEMALSSSRAVCARLRMSDARGKAATGSLKADQVVWSLAEPIP